MKKTLLLLLLFLSAAPTLWAQQEITVKEMSLLERDLEARTNPRKDLNDNFCALIKITVPMLQDMQFKGNVVDNQYTPGEYHVYVPAGTKRIKFQHKDYPSGTIEFTMPIEGQCTYRVVLNVPSLKESYDDLLRVARDYMNNRADHTASAYFDAGRVAYDKVLEHKDCPEDMRETLREERDTMASLRKYTYFREETIRRAEKAAEEQGFDSEECYRNLSGAYKFSARLAASHPEIPGFVALKDSALAELRKHPMGTTTAEVTETVQRQTVTGTVTFKSKNHLPVQSIHVYVSPEEKLDKDQLRLVGSLNADGTYTITVPDGYTFIYFDGAKKPIPITSNPVDVVL